MTKLILPLTSLLFAASANAQTSWTIVPSGTTQDLNAMEYNYMVGDGGTLLTSADNGSTWTLLNTNTPNDLFSFISCGSGCFYFCGDTGLVARGTSNGLVVEDHAIAGYDLPLWNVQIQGTDQPFVVGDSGYFAKSFNFGTVFTQYPTGTEEHLYGLTGFAVPYRIAVGANGTIILSNDLGLTWVPISSGTNADLRDVHTLQSASAIAVGTNGTILRSEIASNGQVWSVISSPVTADLNAVFRDGSSGAIMAVGDGGVILRSLDDGLTWTQLISGSNQDLYDVFPWFGAGWFAIGANGTILRSTDGGGSGVGIGELNGSLVIIGPNPTRDHITIQWNGSSNAVANIQVLDLLGKVLWSDRASLAGPFVVDLSEQATGAYFIRVTPVDEPAVVVRVQKVDHE